MPSEEFSDHGDDNPPAPLLHGEYLKLFRIIMATAPYTSQKQNCAETDTAELRRETLASRNRGNNLVLGRAALGDAFARMRAQVDRLHGARLSCPS